MLPAAPWWRAAQGGAGRVVARRGPALLRRTVDGAVWIGHVRPDDGQAARADGASALKLAATRVLPRRPSRCPPGR